MDKILFRGYVQPKTFQRIGVRVCVAKEHRAKMSEARALWWVTDHYGVMGDFELGGEWGLRGIKEHGKDKD
jgi:tyrosyl-DNA phosphodiesterase 2